MNTENGFRPQISQEVIEKQGKPYSNLTTIRRNSGSISSSNHGFFFNQNVVRQLGCGVGRNSGI